MTRGEVLREVASEVQGVPLLDPEEGLPGRGLCVMDMRTGRDPIKMAAERAAKFIVRVRSFVERFSTFSMTIHVHCFR